MSRPKPSRVTPKATEAFSSFRAAGADMAAVRYLAGTIERGQSLAASAVPAARTATRVMRGAIERVEVPGVGMLTLPPEQAAELRGILSGDLLQIRQDPEPSGAEQVSWTEALRARQSPEEAIRAALPDGADIIDTEDWTAEVDRDNAHHYG